MITNIKSTARNFQRDELQKLEKERDNLVTEHIELMDLLNEMTKAIKDLEAQMDLIAFSIEETGTTKDFRNLEKIKKT